MKIRFLTQPAMAFGKTIKEHLNNHEIAFIATAYLTEDGIKAIEQELLNKNTIKILCGVHGCISDLSALNKLISKSNDKISGRVFLGSNVFHPKLFLFQSRATATLLVGSSNLTGSGLQSNEEVLMECVGALSSQPIVDALAYFNNLWDTNSTSVDKYLLAHPDYSVRRSQNNNLTEEQKQKLNLLKKEVVSASEIIFKIAVNKSLLRVGRQTVPTEYNAIINKSALCSLNESVQFEITLPDGQSVPGRMYHGINNSDYYYQFGISGAENIKKLKDQIALHTTLEYNIGLSKRLISIKRT
jgi:HKD family nuclease